MTSLLATLYRRDSYIGKAAYRAHWQQLFSQYEGDLDVETRDLHVGVSGEFGYATGLQIISGTLKHGQSPAYGFGLHRFTAK
jgi:ketosteroid isomerase-like protein